MGIRVPNKMDGVPLFEDLLLVAKEAGASVMVYLAGSNQTVEGCVMSVGPLNGAGMVWIQRNESAYNCVVDLAKVSAISVWTEPGVITDLDQ